MNTRKDRRPARMQPSINQPFNQMSSPAPRQAGPDTRHEQLLNSRVGTLRMPVVRGMHGIFVTPFSGVMHGNGELSIVELTDPSMLKKPMASACRMGYFLRSLMDKRDYHVAGLLYTTPTMSRLQLVDLGTGRATLSTVLPPLRSSTPYSFVTAIKRITGVEWPRGRVFGMPMADATGDATSALLDSATKGEIPALVSLGFEHEAEALEAMLVDDAALAALTETGVEACAKAGVTSAFIIPGAARSLDPLAVAYLSKEIVIEAPAPQVVEASAVVEASVGVLADLPAAVAEELAAAPDVVVGDALPPAMAEAASEEDTFWDDVATTPGVTMDAAAARVIGFYAQRMGIEPDMLGDREALQNPELAAAMDCFDGMLGDETTIERDLINVAISKAIRFPRLTQMLTGIAPQVIA